MVFGVDMVNPFYSCNRGGVPTIAVQNVNVGTTQVEFVLNNNVFARLPENGLVLVKIGVEVPTGTTQTLPIVFSSNNATQAITNVGNVPLTVADIGTGIYLFYYDKRQNQIQLLSRNS